MKLGALLLGALAVLAAGSGDRDEDKYRDSERYGDHDYKYVQKFLYYCDEYYYYADQAKMRPIGIQYDRDYKYIEDWHSGRDSRDDYYDWIGTHHIYDYDYYDHGWSAWIWQTLPYHDYEYKSDDRDRSGDDDRDRSGDDDRDRSGDDRTKDHYPGFLKYTIHYDYYKYSGYEYYPGQISVEGIWKDEKSMIPIVGGSGYYKGATGYMSFTPYNVDYDDNDRNDRDRNDRDKYIWKIYAYICYVYDYYEYDYKHYIGSRYFKDYECKDEYCKYGHYYKY